MENVKKTMRLYYAFQFFFSLLLWVPVFYEIQKQLGLSDPQIFGIQSIYYFAFLVFEIPTGYFADRWSKLGSLKIGALLLVVANLWPVFFPHAAGFLVHFLWVALARSFVSGASSAYLYEFLHEQGALQRYQKAEGRTRAYSLGGKVLLWAGVSVVMKWNLMLPYTLSAVGSAVAVALVFFLPSIDELKSSPRSTSLPLKEAWLIVKREKELLWVMLQGVALFVFTRVCQINLFQPLLLKSGFDLAFHGSVMGLMTLFEALGSAYPLPGESNWKRVNGLTGLLALSMGALALGVSFSPGLSVVGLVALSYVAGWAYPVQRQLMNSSIRQPELRATFLSLESLIDRAANSLVVALLGPLVAAQLLPMTLAGGAVLVLVWVAGLSALRR